MTLQECVALEELYLSHNGIAKMEGLSTLVNLRVLDVASNKLTEINGIANLTRCERKACIIHLCKVCYSPKLNIWVAGWKICG